MEEVLTENLGGNTFESSNAEQLSNSLATVIRNRLKGVQNYVFSFFFSHFNQFPREKRSEAYFVKKRQLLSVDLSEQFLSHLYSISCLSHNI